ncbi:MAG: hypothetical protein MUO40_11495 [Anaerolineaceae bacterium]|nr:hypothetical protein [Anaerolineaceae bacterium]
MLKNDPCTDSESAESSAFWRLQAKDKVRKKVNARRNSFFIFVFLDADGLF